MATVEWRYLTDDVSVRIMRTYTTINNSQEKKYSQYM